MRHQAEQQAELEATGQQAEPEGEPEAGAAEQQTTEARSQLDISPTELCCLQEKDPSLREAKVTVICAEQVPREILMGPGSNFMSKLLEELYQMLQCVHRIWTATHHPQTDPQTDGIPQVLCTDLWKKWHTPINTRDSTVEEQHRLRLMWPAHTPASNPHQKDRELQQTNSLSQEKEGGV